jgi:folate-binding protein YgfZ
MVLSAYLEKYGAWDIQGAETLSFLQRMSTQHFNDVPVETLRSTLFLNPKGHLQDWVHVGVLSKEHVRLFMPLSRADELKKWCDDYIFMEKIALMPCPWPNPARLLLRLKQPDANWHTTQAQSHVHWYPATTSWATQAPHCAWWGFGDEAHLRQLVDVLKPTEVWQPEDYRLARIREGVPAPAEVELTPKHPLEWRLEKTAIAWNAGCYIGQEVISRMHNYQKVQRRLMGWEATQTPAYTASSADIEFSLYHDEIAGGRYLGRILEYAVHPQTHILHGLALVQREVCFADHPLRIRFIKDNQQAFLPGRLVDCPFWSTA